MESLFASHLEGALYSVREYETLRDPIMSMLRVVASEQLKVLAASKKRADELWEADPPQHPRDILARVIGEYGTPEMLAQFLRTFELVERWWDAKTRVHLPLAVKATP